MAKVHLSVEGRPGCRVGLRDGAENLQHVSDERLLTCLACLRLAADRRRHRAISNLRKQGALLDVADGRPNVIRLNRSCTCRYNDWCSADVHVDLRGFNDDPG